MYARENDDNYGRPLTARRRSHFASNTANFDTIMSIEHARWRHLRSRRPLCCVPITSCKRCARLSQLCKPFHSRSHWEFPICTSGEVETVFLIQSAPLGKRWRRFAENLILSLFNFNFVGRDSSYSRAGGGLLGKRAQEVWEKKRRRGK